MKSILDMRIYFNEHRGCWLKFSFDEWAELARQDQETFERKRTEFINQVIKNSEPDVQHKLQCIQFKINVERKKSKSAMGSCIRMQSMLMDYFIDEFIPTLENTSIKLTKTNSDNTESIHSAVIIPFSK